MVYVYDQQGNKQRAKIEHYTPLVPQGLKAMPQNAQNAMRRGIQQNAMKKKDLQSTMTSSNMMYGVGILLLLVLIGLGLWHYRGVVTSKSGESTSPSAVPMSFGGKKTFGFRFY